MKVEAHERFEGIYWVIFENGTRFLATENLTPGRNVYGEKLVVQDSKEYRLWDPYRSKLGALIMKGVRRLPLKGGDRVLYLGAASGTTASHVSDIVGPEGRVYCVEFSPRSMRDLVNNVCEYRANMIPILEDARFPEKYRSIVGIVGVIYCDIAQPEQARVLADNADMFLRKGGASFLAIKARSIDVTKKPTMIFEDEVEVLRERGFKIQECLYLEPYDRDHMMVVARFGA
ncbi:MAG: fibrillarin-like rRNA/tRNA 2'-O-methyltransferase [Candidatus Bathyarchaeia archaeon]